METVNPKWFEGLVGEDLSGVVFVRDYFQLQFNPPPILNIYTPVTVTNSDGVFKQGERDFANALVGQIDKYVESVRVAPGEAIAIVFTDQSIIELSLRLADYVGPEAFTLFTRDGGIWAE